MCFNKIDYAADRKSAKVSVKCRFHESIVTKSYNWNNEGFTSTIVKEFNNVDHPTDAITLTVRGVDDPAGDNYDITMEPINFIW